MIEREPTAEERIEAALILATGTAASPAMTLSNVMAALGYDFGEPEVIEHQVMQFYADPINNPFVQAQIEARLLLDAGHIEKLAQAIKRRSCTSMMMDGLNAASNTLQGGIEESRTVHHREPALAKDIANVVVHALAVGLTRNGVNDFNDALGQAIDDFIRDNPDEDLG